MKKNDTGEFELVVGNRQLLSGFFILVLLLAVTFAMGYVVGQNSPRSAKLADAASPAPAGNTMADARPQPSQAPPAGPTAQQAADAAAQPAADAPAASMATTAAQDAPPTVAATPVALTPEKPAADSAASAPATPVSDLPAGSYWQVLALHQADAEVVVRTLKDMGFPVLLSPAPKNLMRVLVGPYNDTEKMGRAKSQLENAGFHPIKK